MAKFNEVGNYNGQFIGNSSAKPICGQFVRSFQNGNQITQARIDAVEVVPGMPVCVKTNANAGLKADKGLNPNVNYIVGKGSSAGTEANNNVITGFLLESPTDLLLESDSVSAPVEGQIVDVALLGSGVQVYLPVNATDVAGGLLTTQKLAWDDASNALKKSANGNISIVGPVVDGVRYVFDNATKSAKFADCKCVLAKI